MTILVPSRLNTELRCFVASQPHDEGLPTVVDVLACVGVMELTVWVVLAVELTGARADVATDEVLVASSIEGLLKPTEIVWALMGW
jgi:hypothetical protein